MSFRTRLVIGALIAAWVPVLSLGLLIRSVGADRLTEANERRVEERLDRIVRSWERDTGRMGERLDVLERLLSEDNAARIALRLGEAGALQGAVGRFSASSGTTITYVTDPAGTILAASHFPGDAGRHDPVLAALADEVAGAVVARVPLPTGDITALVRARRLDVGGVGAVAIVGVELGGLAAVQGDSEVSLLAVPVRGADMAPRRIAGDGSVTAGAAGFQGRRPVARVAWEGWDGGTDIVPVDLVVAWQDPLRAAMLRSWDRALLFALAGSAVLALLIGMAMARRMASPVENLAATARRVHLGRLDVAFTRGGARELDRLGFFLNGMLGRIREGLARVRDAEKRATLGELARQVNHDVRNGLIPIRNVMRHLDEAHRTGSSALAETYEARAATVAESLDYLGELADQYQAVAVHGARERSDLRAISHSVVEAGAEHGVRLVPKPGTEPAWVEMDSVSLRRVIENLVANAVAAAGKTNGEVRIGVEAVGGSAAPEYRLFVEDDGPGIPAELRARVFEPFFTTRSEGTGLGLAIARRLVADVGGRIILESDEGKGTRIEMILKAAGEEVR
ncbi:MAG: HAMP domain-containing sensor histidine kinase [Gemmatimonadota bacterium]|nr:HAMP domain-containing sensor histidine kinase [Gemmatimonadota bacterium]